MYIVVWYTEDEAGGVMTDTGSIKGDFWEAFDDFGEAKKRYEEVWPLENVKSASITGVLESTDYGCYLGDVGMEWRPEDA